MPFLDQYRREAQGRQAEIAKLQQRKADEARRAADLRKRANEASTAAFRASSLSTVQSKLRDVQRLEEEAAKSARTIADFEKRIAEAYHRLHEAQKRVSQEESREADQQVRHERDMTRQRQLRDREIETRLTRHDGLHEQAQTAISRFGRLPASITVLFLASNPTDQTQLRLDEEARSITETIRKSKHRDSIRFQTCWAVRPFDILQAINEHTPSIVHFSGHGDASGELVFHADDGATKSVPKEAIVHAIATCSEGVKLVFFNACFSQGQASTVVQHVDAAIGMNAAVDDTMARVFASQFYSALGFGRSVKAAFDQAKAAILLEGLPGYDIPELFSRTGIEATEQILVKPSDHDMADQPAGE